MFFVMSKRVVKFTTGNTEKFAPRASNAVIWTASGPFAKRSLAERAAASALGTHTCLGAMVVSAAEIAEFFSRPTYERPWEKLADHTDRHSMERAFTQAHAMFSREASPV
jgi:hypothetical protein